MKENALNVVKQIIYIVIIDVFNGTANRKLSEKYGLTVYLCFEHHNGSNEGVHFNRNEDLKLKRDVQKIAMKHYNWTTEDFIRIFGKNYIEEDNYA